MSPDPSTGGTAARRAARERATGHGGSNASSSSADRSNRSNRSDRSGASRSGPGASSPSASGRSGERSTHQVAGVDDELRELEEKRTFLLSSIDDLRAQHDKGEVSDEDFEELLSDYTARAAEVIRAIESPTQSKHGSDHGSNYGSKRQDGAPDRRRVGTTLLFGLAVVVVAVFSGVMVARSSGTIPADTSVSSMGTGAMTATGAGGESTGQVGSLMATAQGKIAEAQSKLQAGDPKAAATAFQDALRAFDSILAIEPDNAEAMTYRGWLLHNLALQADEATASELDADALEWLNRAVAADGGYPDARVFRAILLDAAGRPDEALADLDAIDMSTVSPAMTQMIETRRTSIEAQLNQSSPTTVVGGGT